LSIIKTTSVSYQQIEQDILTYIQNKPQAQSWNDFYASSAGTIIIELIAGLSAYERFAITSAIRETYLAEARLRTSVVAIAQTLGYPVFRGANQTFTLTIIPTASATVSKLQVVGTVNGNDVIAISDTILTAGVPTTIQVTFGTVATATVTITSAVEQPFRFIATAVSDVTVLKKNAVVVPVSESFADLAKDVWVTITNPTGAYDAYYYNSDVSIARVNNYAAADVLTLEYVVLDSSIIETGAGMTLTVGTVTSFSEDFKYKLPEASENIRELAPFHADIQHVVRAREDYPGLLKTLLPGISQAAGNDVSPAVVEISYISAGGVNLTAAEKAQFLLDIDQYRPFGISPPTIVDPTQFAVTFDITVYVASGSTTTGAAVTTDLKALWADNFNLLGPVLDGSFFSALEKLAENNLSYMNTVNITGAAGTPASLGWSTYIDLTAGLTLNVTLA